MSYDRLHDYGLLPDHPLVLVGAPDVPRCIKLATTLAQHHGPACLGPQATCDKQDIQLPQVGGWPVVGAVDYSCNASARANAPIALALHLVCVSHKSYQGNMARLATLYCHVLEVHSWYATAS